MKFHQSYTLKEIASIIDCKFIGDDSFPVLGMNEIHVVSSGDIVFVDHPKYYDKALESAATIILINKEVKCPDGKVLLISDDPFRDFNKLTTYFKPFLPAQSSISKSVKIGRDTVVQPNCFIGNDVTIGNNCTIHSNVSIYDNTVIGDNVIIHANTVLGGSAFYYKNRPEGYDQLISGGNVVIENNVDIGASCTIDRGVSASTLIKEGTKIDNLVQIAHNCIMGRACIMAGHSGLAGSVTLGDGVIIGGSASIKDHTIIESGAIVGAGSGVMNNVAAGKTVLGYPASDSRETLKQWLAIRKLGKL